MAKIGASETADPAQARRKLLELLLSQEGFDHTPAADIAPRRQAESPLSYAQERLWFIDQFGPANAAYNIAGAVRLAGPLQVGALASAFAEIVRRHEALRTRFPTRHGRPVQVVDPPVRPVLRRVDLSGLPPARQGRTAEELAGEEARRPFRLAAEMPLRALLIHLGQREHVLLLCLHHIVCDGWSMGILLQEMAVLYSALGGRRDLRLPEPPIQYADFAVWQRQQLAGGGLAAQSEYWRRQLAGAPQFLDLPTDYPRPLHQSFRGARQQFALAPPLAERVMRLGRGEGATLFMTLLAGLATLLSRASGASTVLVGFPVAGRNRRELESLIGCFANTLVLRADLDGAPSFRQLLARVRQTTLAALAHQDLPFERLVEELAPHRDPGRSPLFQVILSLQTAPVTLEIGGDLEMTPVPVELGAAKFDLEMVVEERSAGVEGTLRYSTELFAAPAITRLLGHFESLLQAAAAAPERPIAELPLLRPAERHQLIIEKSWAPAAEGPGTAVHRQFEVQAARRPWATAVCEPRQELSYGELNVRANRLARHLRTLGVGAEVPVALCLERTLDLVVAILAVTKAGGCYVPLDPSHPAERLRMILEDSGTRLLITHQEVQPRLPAIPSEVAVVALDALALPADANAGENLPDDGLDDGEALAYVIYTSGSTGKPKGTLVTRRNLRRLFSQTAAWFGFDEHDVWTLFHSYAFDFSVWELWGALAHGGRLIVVPYGLSRSPESFYRMLLREGVTVLNQTPSAFQQLSWAEEMAAAYGAGELALRLVLLSGEALDMASLAPWFERHGDRRPRLVNSYGITETTVLVTHRPLSRADLGLGSRIGWPIPDLAVYVLGPGLEPVAIGVAGEIYVGGPGVARGYLGRPALTAERFLPDPFSQVGGARLYRSGDLARVRPDGELEHLGRIDHQVKVRGFRIELGEIEEALTRHPAVRSAVVLARQAEGQTPREPRLVAYVTTAPGAAATLEDLRRALARSLPDYMLPTGLVVLDRLPLTPNGKVDRAALPSPASGAPERERRFVAPRDRLEAYLAGLWQEVLGCEPVGIEDDFFALGGTSISGAILINRLQQDLQVVIEVVAIFDTPTVAGLGRQLRASHPQAVAWIGDGDETASAGAAEPWLPLVPVPRPPGTVVPASFAQQRLWFLDQLRSGTPAYNIPVAVSLRGHLDRAALAASLGEITRRHEALRTTFGDQDGEPVQVIAAAGELPPPLVDLSALPSSEKRREVRHLARGETLLAFDLRRGPLVRRTLLALAPDEHVVLLTMHHIISDGWSLGVLVKELAALYPAFSLGRVSPLPELTVQYADFAIWQRQMLQGKMLTEQLDYWRGQLADAPEGVILPLDHPRPPVQGALGSRQPLQLAEPLYRAAKELSLRRSATLFMTLQAIFQVLLHRYTGEIDLVTGTPIANRTRAELEGLIGFFVNTLTMRFRIPPGATFEELLGQVRETTLQAFAHQDLPFERLVEELRPQRRLDRHPLFQITSGLQNTPLTDLELPGLELRYLEVAETATRFDLEIYWWELAAGIGMLLVYDRALWDPVSMVRLGEHFKRLAEELIADPSRHLSEYALLSAAERAALLWEWNDTRIEEPATECVQESFAAAAERTPEAIAVACGSERISYRELNRRANLLCRLLAQRGIGPPCRVGICMRRSIEMVVAVFGVLKAGAAYVPLDPDYPHERLRFMLADAGVSLLLTQTAIVPRLGELAGEPLCLDDSWGAADAADPGNPAPLPSAELPAYVIYTSGSTGRPKGVVIPHRALAHHRRGWLRALPLDGSDRVLQFASLSFDVSAEEIFPCLSRGARLVLRDEKMLASVPEFLRRCEESGITVVNLPTALWLQILACLEAGEARLPKSWRAVLFGGERADPDKVAAWRRLVGEGVRLVNVYGPTETTVTVTWGDLTRQGGDVAPLGWPLADICLRVLDAELQPVAIGVAGELCIEGEYLAHGYLGFPALTAERFIPSAFAEQPGARLYRSGDLVRRLAIGQIEFLGRIDDQVKLRGFRIELGEVETVIEEHPAVRRCKVVLDGGDHLAAYVVPALELPQREETAAAQEAVKQWQRVFDETSLPARPEDTFHSWNSSYTGLPIPAAEMNVWLESTLARIYALGPRRVLEIGCGTGLLLRRIAACCTSYLGTDFSQASLQFLRDQLAGEALPQVELRLRAADDFTDIPAGSRDVVILNSVVQYFPTAEYLLRVLEGAVAAVAPGGAVFLGDVRSLPLEEAFGLSLLIDRAPSSSRRDEVARHLPQALLQQEELLVDPAFFLTLARHLPQIGGVKIEPKRGRFTNELTRFRYDVTLHVGPRAAAPGELQRLDWQAAGLSLAGLRRLLDDTAPPALLIERIPNSRLAAAVLALRWLREGVGGATLGELRQRIDDGARGEAPGDGIDPEDLWDLEREFPYHVELSWVAHGGDGCLSLLLLHRDAVPVPSGFPQHPSAEDRSLPWSAYTNHPLRGRLASTLVPQLREHLLAKLPPFMVPASFVVLDELPMLPSGKVDRRALPVPQRLESWRSVPFVPPRDELERQVVEIWEQILGVQQIGIRDNFFDLGGHSLLAIRMMSRIERLAGRAVSVAALFRRATIEELADGIRQTAGGSQPQPSLITLQPLGDRLPLFFLHPGGGTLFGYLDLVRRLGLTRPVYGLQAPGLDGRSPVVTTVEAMASRYREEMRGARVKGPYLLAGWSFGGMVGLEIARQLRAAGEEVGLVAMLDTAAPGAGAGLPSDFERRLLVNFAEELGLRWNDLTAGLGELIDGGPDQWLAGLDKPPLRDLLPPDLAAHRMLDLFQVFRANMMAAESYAVGDYGGRIVLVNAAEAAGAGRPIPEQWTGLIPDELVETHTVPGSHYTMMREPQVAQLAELLTTLCARAGEG